MMYSGQRAEQHDVLRAGAGGKIPRLTSWQQMLEKAARPR